MVLNLQHLSQDRLARALATLVVTVEPLRAKRTVDVSAVADLGGALFSQHFPMFSSLSGEAHTHVEAQVRNIVNPVEVVLAIDVSTSMLRLLNGVESCTESELNRGCSAERGWQNARMTIVKSAAKDLVVALGPSEDYQVAIGVVPWHAFVRLSPEAITDWARKDWAEYPTRRVYGEPYLCKGSNCSPPASVEQALAPTAPESWKGCLDSHRMGSVGTRASLPAASEFFTAPSGQRVRTSIFFPPRGGAAYECLPHPLPADFDTIICYHGMMVRQLGPYRLSVALRRGSARLAPTTIPLSCP